MPALRTAQILVNKTRYHAKEMSSGTYRDGFAGDPDTSATLIPVLGFVNDALSLFAQAGFLQGDTTIATSAGVREYPISTSDGRIVRYSYIDTATSTETTLREVTMQEMDRRVRGWESLPQGRPRIAIPNGGTVILYPTPSAGTVGNLILRTHTFPTDLVATTDIPQGLPISYHEPLAQCAAMMLCASDADNPARAARIGELATLWQAGDADLVKLISARSIIDAVSTKGGQ